MSGLVHEFSWSASRAANFASCRRRYFHDYYGSWRGWDSRAPQWRRTTYLLKKMTRMPMLAGDCVHRALAEWMEGRARGRTASEEEVTERAIGWLRTGYRESRDGAWRARPAKFTHLAEHHYGEAVIAEEGGRAAEYGGRYRDRIRRCVNQFFALDGLEEARTVDPAAFLALEEMGTIELSGSKVYCIPDFATQVPTSDGRAIRIYDWKTGRPRKADRFQLAVYVLYAREKWDARPEEVTCSDVYLEDGELTVERFDAEEVERVEERIAESMEEMRALHFDADSGDGDSETFPMICDPKSRECATCNYRELCGR
ncbi:MAG: PD-(D/E)XK nuclease family protein [Planctomycetota bacterium]|jgi:hypothetical protein|nr:PD-(D/E)XK nuclease family protein [Planctomycetota bacterium]MDP6761768.1 PD-(D/E)XK nuclease family protein [Planctomycetota bacterium]MDP6989908.1 PD-(D/E)XK nuclease family protein [Planctomycetota bacterium]